MTTNPFTPEIVGWAQAAEGVYQIPSSLSLSAAMLESSLGKATPPGTNNWFGIKDASAVSVPFAAGYGSTLNTLRRNGGD